MPMLSTLECCLFRRHTWCVQPALALSSQFMKFESCPEQVAPDPDAKSYTQLLSPLSRAWHPEEATQRLAEAGMQPATQGAT